MVWTKMLLKTTLVSTFATGMLLLAGATTARADNFDSCRRNVDKWEDRLERDISRHGYYSRQANHDRHELGEARGSCERRYGKNSRDRDDYDRPYDEDRR
jgi:hypothetical protein